MPIRYKGAPADGGTKASESPSAYDKMRKTLHNGNMPRKE
jgi:hypothetical protein